MPNTAIAAHGTLIARKPLGSGSFTTIGNLRDHTPPPLMRNAIETSSHNETDDSYVVGIRRKGEMSLQIGYVPDNAGHDHLTGLAKAWADGTCDAYRITYPDGTAWLFSGYVTNMGVSAPVDDGLVCDVTIRPTGLLDFIE
jgi:predicted secreted protein